MLFQQHAVGLIIEFMSLIGIGLWKVISAYAFTAIAVESYDRLLYRMAIVQRKKAASITDKFTFWKFRQNIPRDVDVTKEVAYACCQSCEMGERSGHAPCVGPTYRRDSIIRKKLKEIMRKDNCNALQWITTCLLSNDVLCCGCAAVWCLFNEHSVILRITIV